MKVASGLFEIKVFKDEKGVMNETWRWQNTTTRISPRLVIVNLSELVVLMHVVSTYAGRPS